MPPQPGPLFAGLPGEGTPLPSWLRKWAALVLLYIEAEAEALPALLADADNPANQGDTFTQVGGWRAGRLT